MSGRWTKDGVPVVLLAGDAGWSEGDHPRAENGEFGSGGGSGGSGGKKGGEQEYRPHVEGQREHAAELRSAAAEWDKKAKEQAYMHQDNEKSRIYARNYRAAAKHREMIASKNEAAGSHKHDIDPKFNTAYPPRRPGD